MKQSQCEDIIANIMLVGMCLAQQTWARVLLAVLCLVQIGLAIHYKHLEKLEAQLANTGVTGPERKS
jgi:hypothetical protein